MKNITQLNFNMRCWWLWFTQRNKFTVMTSHELKRRTGRTARQNHRKYVLSTGLSVRWKRSSAFSERATNSSRRRNRTASSLNACYAYLSSGFLREHVWSTRASIIIVCLKYVRVYVYIDRHKRALRYSSRLRNPLRRSLGALSCRFYHEDPLNCATDDWRTARATS